MGYLPAAMTGTQKLSSSCLVYLTVEPGIGSNRGQQNRRYHQMHSTVSKQEIIERVAERYFRKVLIEEDASLSSRIAQFDSFELADFLMDRYSEKELEAIWQNYVLRRSPQLSAKELENKSTVMGQ